MLSAISRRSSCRAIKNIKSTSNINSLSGGGCLASRLVSLAKCPLLSSSLAKRARSLLLTLSTPSLHPSVILSSGSFASLPSLCCCFVLQSVSILERVHASSFSSRLFLRLREDLPRNFANFASREFRYDDPLASREEISLRIEVPEVRPDELDVRVGRLRPPTRIPHAAFVSSNQEHVRTVRCSADGGVLSDAF